MTRKRIAIITLLGAALAAAPSARAAGKPAAVEPIARVGDRAVDEADIRTAAAALSDDPLRRKDPARWREMLAERCIDRELLAMEAERRGFLKDPVVMRRIKDRDYVLFMGELYQRVLVPGIEPTKHDLDSLQASGLYRGVDLNYMLLPPNFKDQAAELVEQLRHGARFDTTARKWSQHPSRANGGHFGWVLARELDPRSYAAVRDAKRGDILGPYAGRYGCEIYGIRDFKSITSDSIFRLVKADRTRELLRNYQANLLRKHHFALDTTQAKAVLFLAATEPVRRILATLGPDGTRPRTPGSLALGVIARVDGDSMTFPDLARADRRDWGEGEKLHLRDQVHLEERCRAILVPDLVIRDARERGFESLPAVARALRLIREEEATRAMVEREAGGPPDSASERAYYREHAERYRRPPAMRARAICFSLDSAAAARRALGTWLVPGVADSVLDSHGFEPQTRATATSIWPGRYGEIMIVDSDSDPVAAAARGLLPGQASPGIRSVQGVVVVEPLEREAARPLTFEEAAPRVRLDSRAERESQWTRAALSRLRAGTRIEVATARLAKLKLEVGGSKKGTP